MKRALLNLELLVSRCLGRSVFYSSHYHESELTRLMNLFAHADLRDWKGKRVLEVGAGLGRIGEVFRDLGFDVTSTDGRREFVERMKSKGRQSFVLDLDKTGVDDVGDYELVIAFGVLYHLSEPERFLLSCGRKADVLLLESVVCDSGDAACFKAQEAKGWRGQDQALEGVGCRPTPSWVENACKRAGFDVIRDISNPIANWVIGRFDWEVRGTGEWRRNGANLRKMWICEKSPRIRARTIQGSSS